MAQLGVKRTEFILLAADGSATLEILGRRVVWGRRIRGLPVETVPESKSGKFHTQPLCLTIEYYRTIHQAVEN